jgi:Mn-containing catalase
MNELKNLLVEQLQDLISAENQLVDALPKMIEAAQEAKLKEIIQKHLVQTEGQVERLRNALSMVGESEAAEPCKGMQGLLEEGQEVMADGGDKDALIADLALIAAAQKLEHYEISGYGTARCLARQIGEFDIATLLSHSLGEEESADFLLTEVAKPLLQRAALAERGDATKAPWGEIGQTQSAPAMGAGKAQAAAAGASTQRSASIGKASTKTKAKR